MQQQKDGVTGGVSSNKGWYISVLEAVTRGGVIGMHAATKGWCDWCC